jgi:Mg-chelatase subunit ChlD
VGRTVISSAKENTRPSPSKKGGRGSSHTVVKEVKVKERKERPPFEVTFLLDVSSSMRGAAIESCKAALMEIAEILRPIDKLGLRTFSHKLTTVLPLTAKKRLDQRRFRQTVSGVEATGGTALWDAVCTTLEELRDKKHGVTRKLFVLTDGEDMHSKARDWSACSALVAKPGFVVDVCLVAVTEGISDAAQTQLANLGRGRPHYRYKPVSDVGHIVEGLRFFKDIVFSEVTVVKTKTVMQKQVQVKLVPKTKTTRTTTRKRIK